MQCTITLSNRTLYIKVLQKVSVKAKGEKRVSTFHKSHGLCNFHKITGFNFGF